MIITTQKKLIAMTRRAIELIKDVCKISENYEYKEDMLSRVVYLENKLECEGHVGTDKEDIWANELYSIFLESIRYIANPESWVDNLPLLLWKRDQEILIQIVPDGADEVRVTYHSDDGTSTSFVRADILGESNSTEYSV